MKLTPRLKTIAECIYDCEVVADIGSDHGLLPVYLMQIGKAKRIIASDISLKSLHKAEMLVKEYGLQNRIGLKVGDGLKVLKGENVNTVVIAGMGGHLISSILDQSPSITEGIEHFILQPMTKAEELRKWLNNNNYRIYNEKLVKEENRIYQVMCATHGNEIIKDDIFYDIGWVLYNRRDPLLSELIEQKIVRLKKIINDITKKSLNTITLNELSKKLDRYLEVINELYS